MAAPASRRSDAPEPDPGLSFRRRFVLLAIGIVPAVLGLVLIIALKRSGPDISGPRPGVAPSNPASASTRPGSRRSPPSARRDSESQNREREAKALYDAAVTFERMNPDRAQTHLARFREVFLKYPGTSWARKAEEKFRRANDRTREVREKEYNVVVRSAREQAGTGDVVGALESLRAYVDENPDDPLRRRATVELAALENESRAAFNETASAAEELAKSGKYVDAAALFEALKKGAIPEVAARCDVALEELREAVRRQAAFNESRKVDVAHEAFRKTEIPAVLELLAARRYADAVQALDAAAKKPEYAGIEPVIAAERDVIATAAAFWRAFRKAAQSRVNRPVSLILNDGKRVSGTLSRIEPYRLFVRTGTLFEEIDLGRIHPDLLVAWTLGPVLPPDRAESDVKAGLFFFLDGRDDLARLYLATAVEKGASLDGVEPVFRGGYVRAARHAAAEAKKAAAREEASEKKEDED